MTVLSFVAHFVISFPSGTLEYSDGQLCIEGHCVDKVQVVDGAWKLPRGWEVRWLDSSRAMVWIPDEKGWHWEKGTLDIPKVKAVRSPFEQWGSLTPTASFGVVPGVWTEVPVGCDPSVSVFALAPIVRFDDPIFGYSRSSEGQLSVQPGGFILCGDGSTGWIPLSMLKK